MVPFFMMNLKIDLQNRKNMVNWVECRDILTVEDILM